MTVASTTFAVARLILETYGVKTNHESLEAMRTDYARFYKKWMVDKVIPDGTRIDKGKLETIRRAIGFEQATQEEILAYIPADQ